MTRAARALAFVLAFATSSAALAQTVPLDEKGFTDFAAERLRKHAPDTAVAVKAPLTLTLGELQLNLDRVFRFCQGNARGCEAELDRYVGGAAHALKERSAPATREAVRLVVRSSAYAKTAQATVRDIQPRPLVTGLVVLPVLDLPRTLRLLTERDNKVLGLGTEEVFDLALANVKRNLKPLMDEAKPAGRGQIGYLQGNVYHPSRLISPADWAPLAQAQGGTLLVTAPASDTVLFISEATPAAIDALRALARDVGARARLPLSDVVLRWTPAGWEVVP